MEVIGVSPTVAADLGMMSTNMKSVRVKIYFKEDTLNPNSNLTERKVLTD